MAKLSDKDPSESPQSVIVYGAPKSGKTLLAGGLAAKYKLIWLDLENGHSTLFQLPKKLQENIELIQVLDTKDAPVAIDTVMRLLTGTKYKVCDAHGKIGCAKCITKPLGKGNSEYQLSSCSPKDCIVVIDSFTQLTSSAQALSTKGLDPTKGQFEEFKHYRVQGSYLEKCLDLIQNSPFHVVVLAHEAGIEQVDKSEKIMPAGGTKNFGRSVSKYFGHIVHMGLKNKKHKASSTTTDSTMILAGSRTNFDIDIDDPLSFCKLFEGTQGTSHLNATGVKSTVKPRR